MRFLAPLARLVHPISLVALSTFASSHLLGGGLTVAGTVPDSPARASLQGGSALAGKGGRPARATGPAFDAITATTYPFTFPTAVLEDMSTGTTQLVAADQDDTASAVFNQGFDFFFDGVRYTQFSANANGLIRLTSAALGSLAVGTTFSNDLATSTNVPQVAPYWDDLRTGTNGKVHAKVIGTAPNRKLVIEWLNMQIPRLTAVGNGAGTFQAWLFESTGVIQFVYGSGIAVNTTNSGASIGFGSSATAFASVTTATPSVAYGTANNANTGAIASGTSYVFTPTVPTAPTNLTFTNVTATQTTLNWADNATNELGYPIYFSTDNVNFSYLGQAAANATNVTITGLTPGTTYYYRVHAVTEGALSTALSGSQATAAPSLSGTKSVGPTGDYASLTAAITAINTNALAGPLVLELQAAYVSTVETFPLTFPALPGSSATNIVTVRPAAGSTALSITSANTTATIALNGGSNIVFDGRPGGTGTAKQLTLDNTATAGVTALFVNGARNNVVRYCTVSGVNTSVAAGGVVFFSTSTATVGNSNNTIDTCDIRDGATTPTNAIFSAGTTTTTAQYNTANTVSNCNLFNFYNSTSTTSGGVGMYLSAGSTDWTITGNSFYQTATRTTFGAAAVVNAMLITGALGNNFLISGNFFGGTAPSAGGTPWTINAATTVVFRGLQLTVGTTTPTSIQGNTFQNLAITTTSTSTAQSLFSLVTGSFNVGTVTGNTLGSQSATGSVTFTTSGSAAFFTAMLVGTGTPGALAISNNTVGGITVANTGAPATGTSVRGIGIQGAPTSLTLSNNTVGSATVANSISSSTTSSLLAIFLATTNSGSVIFGNTVANVSQTSASAGIFAGMYVAGSTGGSFTVTGNTVRNLTSASTSTSTGVSASINGIAMIAATTAGQVLSGNTVHSLVNTGAAATVSAGIYWNGPTSGTNLCARNFVHSLVPGSALATVNGISVGGGLTTYQNNMIRLGVDPAGASITLGATFNGVTEPAVGTDNFYFNSIYIGGTGVVSSLNTFAFNSTQTAVTRAYQDNIFVNSRSNASGTGKNYAVQVGGTAANPAGLTINYNIYQATGTGGVFGRFNALDVATLDAWRVAVGQDGNSIYADPQFLTPNGTAATVNLHLNPAAATPAEGSGLAIAGITDDFDGETRANLTPTDIGADAGNFIAADFSPPTITYAPLGDTTSTAPRALTATITDPSGVPTSGTGLPVLYYRVGTSGAYTAVQGTSLGNNQYQFTFPGANAGDTIQYYIAAQDNLGNVGTSPSGGAAGFTANPPAAATPPTATNSYQVKAAITGSFNVGAGQAYTTITAAVAALNGAVLTGPVTFLLKDASYAAETLPITVNANSGSSAANTVTFKPDTGVTSTVTGSSSSAVFVLNGADYVIFEGSNSGGTSRDVTVTNTSTGTSSAVIWLQTTAGGDGATNNVIRNLVLTGSGNTQTLFGVGAGSATIAVTSLGIGNNANTFQNNAISKTQYGIYSQGASAAAKNTGNVITQNVLNAASPNNIQIGGIMVGYEDGIQITRNAVGGMNRTTSVFGIAAGFVLSDFSATVFTGNEVTNATITRNVIDNLASTSATGYSAIGIGYASAATGTTTIANNFVSRVVDQATSPDFNAGIFVGGGAGTLRIYYNSVYLSGSRTAATFPSFALAVGGSTPVVDIRDNALENTSTSTGTGKSYAIGFAYTSTTGNYANLVSNYNDLFTSGTSAGFSKVGSLTLASGTEKTTLAALQAETGRDANSLAVNPAFNSTSDLHVTTASPLANAGTPLAGVTTDFDGEMRSANRPDIGADEIYPLSLLLSTLTTTADPLTPPFASGTFTYATSVANNVATFSVTPTAQDSNATIQVRINGGTYTTVASGASSAALPLNVGSNTVDIRVTAEDTTTQLYTITVTRAGAPAISVADGGTTLADGASTVDFGSANVGASVSKTFTITNTGSADLNIGAITVDGAQASEFVAGAPGTTTVSAGNSTTFTVTFTPAGAGTRNAAVHVASNVSGSTNPFDFNVTGTGLANNVAPQITSANTTTFQFNAFGSFQVTATGSPAPTFSYTGTLPNGVTFTSGGLLSGTPTVGGTFPITITASNGTPPNATQNFTLVVNRPPMAGADTMATRRNTAATITVNRLRANDSDPDGDPLTITSVSGSTAQGGNASLSGGTVTYTPPTGYTGADSFTYQLADGHGGFATGTVSVSVTVGDEQSLRTESITMSGGSVTIVYAGVPGYAYQVQYQDTMAGPWTNAGPPITADSTGRVTYTDPNPPANRFYRAIAP